MLSISPPLREKANCADYEASTTLLIRIVEQSYNRHAIFAQSDLQTTVITNLTKGEERGLDGDVTRVLFYFKGKGKFIYMEIVIRTMSHSKEFR